MWGVIGNSSLKVGRRGRNLDLLGLVLGLEKKSQDREASRILAESWKA